MQLKENKRIQFFKMSGSGNDFIMIDNRELRLNSDDCEELVLRACRRKISVGADGMILIENDPEADFKWRFFNADGSEAEMCGNGARCAARFAYLKDIVRSTKMRFRTLAGIIEAEIFQDRVKIRVTAPYAIETDIALQVERDIYPVHFINTGVPHTVYFLDSERDLEEIDVFRLGRAFRIHPRFQPAGSNANFALVRDLHHMTIRTYERGVEDETLACGTGSIACALIAAVKDRVASPVDVLTRSGETLTIHFEKQSQQGVAGFEGVYLEGDARVVYEAELWDETLQK